MTTLHLTSPYMTGKAVRAAQQAMQKNEYGVFYRGEIDGEFGPLTASASKDAKFWLGYEPSNVRPGYGDALKQILVGEAELSDPMKKRRQARRARPPEQRLRGQMLQVAISQLGTVERPADSNIVKYSTWYGVRGPWCAMFVTWCGVQAGLSAFDRGSRWAYCPFVVNDAREGKNGLRARGRSEAAQPGDLVLYDWDGNGVADHIGIFEKGTRNAFTAIEGNTAIGNDSNGGEVMRRWRKASQVVLFAYAVR